MAGPALALRVRKFRVPRRDYSVEECEDFADYRKEQGRFAIADGAAESFFGGLWAKLLVEAFVLADNPEEWRTNSTRAQEEWREQVKQAVDFTDLPWYAESRARVGGFATFLGLLIDAGVESVGRWHALAVGDTCLFQSRGERLIDHFPVRKAAEFSSTPWLVGSLTPPDKDLFARAVPRDGDWQAGDRLWLMTDALAHWCLSACETEGGAPWNLLESFLDRPEPRGQEDRAFTRWIDQLRNNGRLRNDDVTLVAIGL